MEETLRDLENVEVIMDDILIHGVDSADHDEKLNKALAKIKSSGLKLNRNKCLFSQSKLQFMGHIVGKDGVDPDPDKIQAILDLKPPTNVTETRRLLGMVNYLGRFLPNLSTVTQPLNELLRNDRAWTWGPAQEGAFNKLKTMLTTSPSLQFYELGRPTLVSADASSYGIGGVLLQEHDGEWKPVAFCSRTLTDAERKYAQIEKECLASVWTCERFTRYLRGLPSFKLITDHKPLVPLINSKDVDQVPLRCQRLLIRMMRFNPQAVYAPGKDLVIADTLSRNPSTRTDNQLDLEQEVTAHVAYAESLRPASSNKLARLREATLSDPQLQVAIKYTQFGWPVYARDVDPTVRDFVAMSNRLSYSDGLLLLGQRIVIPRNMRSEMIDRIHDGHQGLTKCRKRAQSAIWWPGITMDIKKKVESCTHCSLNKPTQCEQPLLATPLPDRPWQKIAADLCEIHGQRYLIVVDYFSRWIEILNMSSTVAEQVISKLKSLFARFGVPDLLITDNGPQFTAHDFAEFAAEYDFEHRTTSPYFPHANGEAERAVQTAKRILKQPDPVLALLTYRATPIAATGVSPAQLLMGRNIKSPVPILSECLMPEWPDMDQVRAQDQQTKLSYQRDFNTRHGARPLAPLHPGDAVRIKLDSDKTWEKSGVVMQKSSTPRSFIVATPGGTFRRNRRHIQLTPTAIRPEMSHIPDDVEINVSPGSAPTRAQPVTSEEHSSLDQAVPAATAAQPVTTRYGRPVRPPARFRDV